MNNDRNSIFLPEEIWVDILLRLNIKPLFRCKCVSRELNSIVSDLEFGHKYMQGINSGAKSSSSSQHLWGILPSHTKRYQDSQPKSSVDIDVDADDSAPLPLYVSDLENNDYKSYILHSSNGLILCLYPQTWHPSERKWVQKLCVTNPLTKQSAELPLLSFTCYQRGFGFATRADHGYVRYRVVCIRQKVVEDNQIIAAVSTFCSDSGRWDEKEWESCPEVVLESKPYSCRGVLHWFDWDERSLVTYDPYDAPDRFCCTQFPSTGSDSVILDYSGMNLVHLGHEDSLKFGDVELCNEGVDAELRVWRLVEGGWALEGRCGISPLWGEESLRMCTQLVAPDPWNEGFFCDVSGDENKFVARDVGSAQEVCVGANSESARTRTRTSQVWSYSPLTSRVPIALCPWSSPFYGQSRSNSSSVIGFRKISPVWFPSFTD